MELWPWWADPLVVLRVAHLYGPTQPAVWQQVAAVAVALVLKDESAELLYAQRRPRLPVILHCASHQSLQRPQQFLPVLRAAQGRACSQLRPQRLPGRPSCAQAVPHLLEGSGYRCTALRGGEAVSGETRALARPVSSTIILLSSQLPPARPSLRSRTLLSEGQH